MNKKYSTLAVLLASTFLSSTASAADADFYELIATSAEDAEVTLFGDIEKTVAYYDMTTGEKVDADKRQEGVEYKEVAIKNAAAERYNLKITQSVFGEESGKKDTVYFKYVENDGVISLEKVDTADEADITVNRNYNEQKQVQNNVETNPPVNFNDAVFAGMVSAPSSNPYGSAIWNYYSETKSKYPNIGSINGDFIGNSVSNVSAVDENGSVKTTSSGGAIYNQKGKIGSIVGNFIGNSVIDKSDGSKNAQGGAIGNTGNIGTIEGNFAYNSALGDKETGRGGAIDNMRNGVSAHIDEISGTFIGNVANLGGAIHNGTHDEKNELTSVIESIDGTFIGNKAIGSNGQGGAIADNGSIYTISGLFANNEAYDGGAIYRSSGQNSTVSESKISGEFYSNKATEGGAISLHDDGRDSGKKTSVEGTFIGNSSTRGGAISVLSDSKEKGKPQSDIDFIKGNFIRNISTEKAGAVHVSSSNVDVLEGGFYNNEVNATESDIATGGAIFAFNSTIGNLKGIFSGNGATGNSSAGGALNVSGGSVGKISDTVFVDNFAVAKDEAKGEAKGGAIYISAEGDGVNEIVNTSFINNYVEGTENTSGGAIWSAADLNIKASDATSLFSGNKANGDYNAIYVSNADLNLTAEKGGMLIFNDSINGKDYNLNILGDSSSEVVFNNNVNNVAELSLGADTVTHLGTNANIFANNMTSIDTPQITLDVYVDAANNKIEIGTINVANDVSGNYNIVINALNEDMLRNDKDAIVPFLFAPNDDLETESSFTTRIEGSPYLWYGAVNVNGESSGSTWYLNLDVEDESVVAPEVGAGAGLHEAAIEQTRSVVRNVSNKVASGHGALAFNKDGEKLRNLWVLAQGEAASIKKPIDMDAKIWGIEAGYDLQEDENNTLGIFASYRRGDYDISGKGHIIRSDIGSKIDIDSYLAGLYYRYDKNQNWLFASLYGGIQQAEFKTDDRVVSFDTDGIEFGGSIEAGHTYMLSDTVKMDPSLGLYYTQINFDDAHDNVGKKYSWDDIKHLEAEAAVRLTKQYDKSSVYVKPSVIQTITGSDKVRISGMEKLDTYKDGTLGRIEVGGRYIFSDALTGYSWANYTFGSNYEAAALGVGLSYRW